MIISTNDIATEKTKIFKANLIVKVIRKMSRSLTTISLSYWLNYDLYAFYANIISIYCNKGFKFENQSFSFFESCDLELRSRSTRSQISPNF